jgi:hypothetical protein
VARGSRGLSLAPASAATTALAIHACAGASGAKGLLKKYRLSMEITLREKRNIPQK